MKRFVRCLAMWLLVFALPLQGDAAATMLPCGAAHLGTVRIATGGHDHASHPHAHGADAIDGSASIDHGAAAHAVAPHHGSTAGSHATEHAQGLGKCSARAACCTQFTRSGTIAFACLQPGQYEAGMKGRVIVAGQAHRRADGRH